MTGSSYLAIWTRVRKKIEEISVEEADREELDQITKLLERAQKGELALREDIGDGPIVVNIHIPGVCGPEE